MPSTDFRTSSSNKDRTLFIRGIGTISTSPGVEPSVSTVIDGVVLGRSGQATLDLLDIDHVEVLRGPQGTLFGKNASAGVINIVTKDPGEDFHGFVNAGLYSGADEYRLSAGISGALVANTLKGALTVLGRRRQGQCREHLPQREGQWLQPHRLSRQAGLHAQRRPDGQVRTG